MSPAAVITLAVSVLLAGAGYVWTYHNNVRLAQREGALERVNAQLRDFYGPLLANVNASNAAWDAFRSRYRPNVVAFWADDPPATSDDAESWRLWIRDVFMPLNVAIVDVITRHADLLDDPAMPQPLLDACAHVAAYRALLGRWDNGDYSEHKSLINYPREELLRFTRDGFARAKREQQRLLGDGR